MQGGQADLNRLSFLSRVGPILERSRRDGSGDQHHYRQDQSRGVAAVEVKYDTDLYDLTVRTRHGTEVIDTHQQPPVLGPGRPST
jgi:hypothetical protein